MDRPGLPCYLVALSVPEAGHGRVAHPGLCRKYCASLTDSDMEKKSHNKEQIFVIALLVVMLLMFIVIPTFAQSTNTLDLDVSNITPNLFLGANIMIAALLAVMMLVAGLTFGMNILSRIVRAIVSGIR
jgi:hypothetical protein